MILATATNPLRSILKAELTSLDILSWEEGSGSREPLGSGILVRVKKRGARPRNPQVPPLLPIANRECPGGLWLTSHKATEREGTTHSSDCFLWALLEEIEKRSGLEGKGSELPSNTGQRRLLTFTKLPGPLQPNLSSLRVPLMIFKQKCHPCGIYAPLPGVHQNSACP